MLNIKDVGEELEQKIEAVRGYVRERSESSKEYQQALEKLTIEPFDANDRLPRYSGARILESGFIKPFVQQWKNRADAQNWMDRTLSNTTVGAVDGSQIYPDKTYNLPIAVIQTASIYNKHTNAKSFKQKTNALIITPEEFEAAHVYTYSDEFVDAHRFKAECEQMQELLHAHDQIFVLLDGSLILSHINALNKNIKYIYLEAIKKLLQTSTNTENTLTAYTDNSHPRDLTQMLQKLYNLKKTKLQDTYLIQPYMPNWGDRTSAFLCDRDDRRATSESAQTKSILDMYGQFKDQIAFFYINLSNRVGRVEYPRWAHEQGLTETIANILRAESIIRGGYPDLLIQAHKAALIRNSEHSIFYTILENFCHTHHILLPKSTKQLHKRIIRP